MSRVLVAVVLLIAFLEAAALILFGVFALSGDDLGVARAMLTLLLGPFAVTTAPALVLLSRGRLLPSLLLVALSVPLMWLAWFLA